MNHYEYSNSKGKAAESIWRRDKSAKPEPGATSLGVPISPVGLTPGYSEGKRYAVSNLEERVPPALGSDFEKEMNEWEQRQRKLRGQKTDQERTRVEEPKAIESLPEKLIRLRNELKEILTEIKTSQKVSNNSGEKLRTLPEGREKNDLRIFLSKLENERIPHFNDLKEDLEKEIGIIESVLRNQEH